MDDSLKRPQNFSSSRKNMKQRHDVNTDELSKASTESIGGMNDHGPFVPQSSRFCRCHGLYERSCPSLGIPRAVALGMRDELAFQQKKGFFDRLIDTKIGYVCNRLDNALKKKFALMNANINDIIKAKLEQPQVENNKSLASQQGQTEEKNYIKKLVGRLENAEKNIREMNMRMMATDEENKSLRSSLAAQRRPKPPARSLIVNQQPPNIDNRLNIIQQPPAESMFSQVRQSSQDSNGQHAPGGFPSSVGGGATWGKDIRQPTKLRNNGHPPMGNPSWSDNEKQAIQDIVTSQLINSLENMNLRPAHYRSFPNDDQSAQTPQLTLHGQGDNNNIQDNFRAQLQGHDRIKVHHPQELPKSLGRDQEGANGQMSKEQHSHGDNGRASEPESQIRTSAVDPLSIYSSQEPPTSRSNSVQPAHEGLRLTSGRGSSGVSSPRLQMRNTGVQSPQEGLRIALSRSPEIQEGLVSSVGLRQGEGLQSPSLLGSQKSDPWSHQQHPSQIGENENYQLGKYTSGILDRVSSDRITFGKLIQDNLPLTQTVKNP